MSGRRIAVVGSGISGLLAARLLCRRHQVTVFEAGACLGGHSATVDAVVCGRTVAIDTGFIVYNDRTYPNFTQLIDRLGVAWRWSDMSFGVRCDRTGLEYSGNSLRSLFAQKRNLLRPRHWGMLRDILRFRTASRALLADGAEEPLGAYLARAGFGREFVERFIVPMGAAIWSAEPRRMLEDFPARFFARFFAQHGFLDADRPPWKTIAGGSREYVAKLAAPFRDRALLRTPVEAISRFEDRVEVRAAGETRAFDDVVIAAHSDDALQLLVDPSAAEREILGALPYRRNRTWLHTDAALLPRRKLAWASWNYLIPRAESAGAAVTYWMNRLQSLATPEPLFVTLNHAPRPERVLREFVYAHPVFTPAGVAAQARHGEISGVRRTHYCGAYWRNGFHEDGVVSALAVAKHFGAELADAWGL